jgi:hypothetical protein
VLFTAKATYYSKKSIAVKGVYYHYRKEIDGQISVITENNLIERVKVFLKCQRTVIDFINKATYEKDEDYIDAYKRCLWRYDHYFYKNFKFDVFNLKLQKIFFNEFYKSLVKCKELHNIEDEIYYIVMSKGNFEEYTKYMQRKVKGDNIIISLTSYPARIETVVKTIRTLLNQTKKPKKILLWLALEQFPNRESELPCELQSMVGEGLIIEWCKDLKSFKKLIPAIKKYPDHNDHV